MNSVVGSLSCALLFLGWPVSAEAEEKVTEVPGASQIREHYDEAADHWPGIPQKILQAFVAGEDRRFFER